jgi:CheY-like chemotaxis protein
LDLHRVFDDLEDMFHLGAINVGLPLSFQREENIPRYICTDFMLSQQWVKKASAIVLTLPTGQPTYKILVVDDKPINCQLLIKLLSPLAFEMKDTSNGKDTIAALEPKAIALWEDWEPHLIWMDMKMPVMDGYEATKYIKSTRKGNATAIIALRANV